VRLVQVQSLVPSLVFTVVLAVAGCKGTDTNSASGACGDGGSVLINELVANPAGDDSGKEWVELFNPSASDQDVSGWTFFSYKSGGSSNQTDAFPDGTVVPAGGYLVLGGDLGPGVDVVVETDIGSGSDGDGLYLIDSCDTEQTIDGVVFGNSNDDGAPLEVGGEPAPSWAPKPGDDEVLARCPNGQDTGDALADFALIAPEQATPGAENDCPCVDLAADVTFVVNEFLPNPSGSDAGAEWVEIFNSGSTEACLDGWVLAFYKGNAKEPSADGMVPIDTFVSAGGFALFGAGGIDIGVDIGNGDGGDGIWLLDPKGTCEDDVVYGGSNEDGIMGCDGTVATSVAAAVEEDASFARFPDGADTGQSGVDFTVTTNTTPGSPNEH
jgi:hypothetical protein